MLTRLAVAILVLLQILDAFTAAVQYPLGQSQSAVLTRPRIKRQWWGWGGYGGMGSFGGYLPNGYYSVNGLEMLKERDLKPKECWMPACSLRESVETIATLVKVILMVALLVYAGAAMTVSLLRTVGWRAEATAFFRISLTQQLRKPVYTAKVANRG
ncbi:unnamed protein product [Toxocara canis]|uniref:Secreted protein n=1 Tax=Toxocara canis TaxID=6265 RepID=A0A183UU18_TOXCA|nr:unnamed protein product [Toxocara canis]